MVLRFSFSFFFLSLSQIPFQVGYFFILRLLVYLFQFLHLSFICFSFSPTLGKRAMYMKSAYLADSNNMYINHSFFPLQRNRKLKQILTVLEIPKDNQIFVDNLSITISIQSINKFTERIVTKKSRILNKQTKKQKGKRKVSVSYFQYMLNYKYHVSEGI